MTTESSKNQDFIRKHPSEGMDALEKESKLPLKGWETEVARAKEYGLEGAKSIVDRNISTFSRGELPLLVVKEIYIPLDYSHGPI